MNRNSGGNDIAPPRSDQPNQIVGDDTLPSSGGAGSQPPIPSEAGTVIVVGYDLGFTATVISPRRVTVDGGTIMITAA